MRALLFCDWCAVRDSLSRVLAMSAIVAVPIAFASGDGEAAAASAQAAAAPILTMMMTFYLMIGVFGADEQGGWEQVRLALPVTARDVVRERYACIAIGAFAAALVGTVASVVLGLVFGLIAGQGLQADPLEALAAALGMAVGALSYMALLMPVVFRMGLAKARVLFSLPFVLIMLLSIGPVSGAVRGLVERLDGLSATLGSPAPLVAGAMGVAALLYGASMLASERIYAARDF